MAPCLALPCVTWAVLTPVSSPAAHPTRLGLSTSVPLRQSLSAFCGPGDPKLATWKGFDGTTPRDKRLPLTGSAPDTKQHWKYHLAPQEESRHHGQRRKHRAWLQCQPLLPPAPCPPSSEACSAPPHSHLCWESAGTPGSFKRKQNRHFKGKEEEEAKWCTNNHHQGEQSGRM